ncbi:protocadherin-8-like [Mixophyes fleayi]|uniref:protocadherin-8-like n=1 Tax=Mixophyes fleayi TaxID=3061075 RepID=UPI003F4E01C6
MLGALTGTRLLLLTLCFPLCFGEFVHFYTYEEEPPGTVIAVLSQHSMFNSTEGPVGNFRLMKQFNNSFIHVRERDGQLSIGERIDREKICRRSPHCVLALDLVSLSEEQFKLFNVKVEVRDINDNSPRFPSSEILVDVSEAAPVGTRIPLQMAMDEDLGLHSVQNYLISGNKHFGIDVQTRADGLKYADLILMKDLDRESRSSYKLELVASDGGSPSLSGSATVQVRVLDFNDNSPTFEDSSITVDLMEDAPVGHLLLDLNAVDLDEGANGEIAYGFSAQVSEEVRELFKIDPKSGCVTLEGEVDFETKPSYEFDVQAQDLGPNPLTATCKITVHIVDVNDNAPIITITPLTSSDKGVVYISEAAAKDTFIALISTSDIDSGLNGKVHCILLGHDGHFKLQQAYEDSFMIVTTSLLDREHIAEYQLTLLAEDLGSPSLKTEKQYTIKVLDENDNAPSFTKPLYDVSILENNAPGAYITTVTAIDPDFEHNGKISYRLMEGKYMGQSLSTFVAIDADSGVVRAVRSLDYEKLKELDLEIEASDYGVPKLSTRTQLKIKIIDENDNPPKITSPLLDNGTAEILLPIGAPENYLVFRVKAVDADDGLNSQLSYTLQHNKHRLFTINRASGEVSLYRRIDPLQQQDFSIVVAVYDSGRPALFSNATIKFILTDSTPSNVEIVIMPSSEEDLQQVDMSIIFIAVLSGGCTLLLVAILFVACSCKKRSDHAKRELEESRIGRETEDTTNLKEFTTSSTDSCELSLSTENCSEMTSRGLCRDPHTASSFLFQSSISGPCRTDWQPDKSAGSTRRSHPEQYSAKDSGRGDSDFYDSASDTSGEGVRKGCGPPSQETTGAPHIEKAMAYHSAESQFIHRSNRSLYNGQYTIQYQKEYAVAYSMAPSYYNTYHPRLHNAHVPHYSIKDSYYHINHQPVQTDCERDPLYRSATLSPSRGHREFNYKPEIPMQTHSEEVATTF